MTAIENKWVMVKDAKLTGLLSNITASINRIHPDSTVILFGSYARGDQHEDSDLDICVLVPELTSSRLDMKVEIRRVICDMCYAHGLSFDMKLYTYREFEQEAQYKSSFQHAIMTEGVTLSA